MQPKYNFHAHRMPALDGVRGLAILLVFAVHTTPILLHGGRIGVDLFFVLSGFLITSILLQEYRQRGSIHLGFFYMRRVLRLLPAMLSVVLFVTLYVRATAPEQLALTLHNAQGVIFYYFNWQLNALFPDHLLGHQWMFSHFWSLSVEEQFYIVWPLALLTLLGSRVPKKAKFVAVSCGILLPAIARAVLWSHDPSLKWYFRTDTHFDGLMWGALAALLIDAGVVPTGQLRKSVAWGGVAATIGLLVIASFEGLTNGFLYLIGFALVGLCSAWLIYSMVCCPLPTLRTIFEFPALRWVGRISYGLYLWHWPIIRIFAGYHLPPYEKMVLEFGVIFSVATISYYGMEQPVLRLKARFSKSVYKEEPQ